MSSCRPRSDVRARALSVLSLAAIVAALGALGVAACLRSAAERAPAAATPTEPTTVSVAAAPLAGSAAPRAPVTSPSTSRPTEPAGAPVVWPFGAGGKALGRGRTPDGRPVAPASFLVDGDGLVILDQENARIVRGDGSSIPLPGEHADDLARADDGSLAVLDRLDARDVTIVEPDGRVRGRLPLEGPGIEDARDVSRVVVSGRDVYVERSGGGPLLRVGTTDGKPADARGEIAGIPTRDGSALLSAGITSEEEGRAWVTVADARGAHRWTRELRFAGELSAVGFLDGGGRDAVWAVLLAGATRAEYVNWAVCLDATSGAVRASSMLAVEDPPWESFSDFAARDDGSLVVALRSEAGVSYSAYPCGGAE